MFPSAEIRLMPGKTEPPEEADTAGAAKLILWQEKCREDNIMARCMKNAAGAPTHLLVSHQSVR